MKSVTPKLQGRRPTPKARKQTRAEPVEATLTVGDLIAAAFDTLDSASSVASVLSSNTMRRRIGRKLVFI